MNSQNQKPNNLQGFQVLKLHYSADEDKDERWAEQQKKELPSEDWDREYELRPVGHVGNYPVFGDYKRALHENDKLVYQRSIKTVYRGWDFGKVHPCVEFIQVDGLKKNVIGECFGTQIQLPQFCEQVIQYSTMNFPGAMFIDWVDATGKNEKDNGLPSVQILRQYGIKPRWRMQDVEEGIRLIREELVKIIDGRPYLQFNPKLAPQLVKSFRGGYQRKKNGIIIKDGEFDHAPDAYRYAFTGIVTTMRRDKSDFYDKIKNYRYVPQNKITGR